MPRPIRQAWLIEEAPPRAPKASLEARRQALVRSTLQALRSQARWQKEDLDGELSPLAAARVRRVLIEAGLSVPDGPLTVEGALRAVVGDFDGDGQLDIELGLLERMDLLDPSGSRAPEGPLGRALREHTASLQRSVRFEDGTRSAVVSSRGSGPNGVSVIALKGRWVVDAKGQIRPFTGELRSGERPVDRIQIVVLGSGYGRIVAFSGANEVARHSVDFRRAPPRTAGLDAGPLLLRELFARKDLREQLERGTPAYDAISQWDRKLRLSQATAEPSDDAERVIYRAMRVSRADYEALGQKIEATWGVAARRDFEQLWEARSKELIRISQEMARPDLGVTAEMLYVTAMREGFILYLSDRGGPDGPHLEMEIDGFQYLGTDVIGSAAPSLKRKGFLRADYRESVDYYPADAVGEKGAVLSAHFPDARRGFEAVVALLASARAQFLADAKTYLGLNPDQLTEAQIFFFTSVYFNGGPGTGRRLLRKRGLDLARPWRGAAPATNGNVRYNALRRTATWDLIRRSGVFTK